jgi:hypothetical protein
MSEITASDKSVNSPSKACGFLLVAAACASLVLLAIHPGDSATDFAGVLRSEAAGRFMDAIVHGGFAVLLVVEFICLANFSTALGLARTPVVAGLTFFAAGSAAFAASVFIDGLVLPAIAVKYLAAPTAKLDEARALFILSGAMIGALQPLAILFQWAAVACWSAVLVRMKSRFTGILGMLLAGSVLAALFASLTIRSLAPLGGGAILIAGILGQALWLAAIGVRMIRTGRW